MVDHAWGEGAGVYSVCRRWSFISGLGGGIDVFPGGLRTVSRLPRVGNVEWPIRWSCVGLSSTLMALNVVIVSFDPRM